MNIASRVISIGFMVGTTITMYMTFLIAYFSKGKSVTVFINKYGEAQIEMALITILMYFMFKYVVYSTKKISEDMK